MATAKHKVDVAKAKMLRSELTKVRCWMTGFGAGRQTPGAIDLHSVIPGADSLRQTILFLDALIAGTEQ